MRLQPVAANSLRRLAVRDVRLSNGVVIPAGVIVELAQYSVFRNPAWGWEDPDAFKPVSSPSDRRPRLLELVPMLAVHRQSTSHWGLVLAWRCDLAGAGALGESRGGVLHSQAHERSAHDWRKAL